MADETTTQTAAQAVPGISGADIADAAVNPSSFSVEGLSQTNRSLSELIAADEYLRRTNRAARRRHPLAGVGFAHAIPPGTCDR